METANLGRILTLLGLILVLLTGWARRRVRLPKPSASPWLLRLQNWGRPGAFLLILAGLLLMYHHK
uniref:Uncharacterized protein n=1 Tax=Desulfobacca acetoxidans TaxID=60893 RepID=A0A7C3SLA5_9BACT